MAKSKGNLNFKSIISDLFDENWDSVYLAAQEA